MNYSSPSLAIIIFQTQMNTKMDEQMREVVELKAQVQAVLHMIEYIEEHTVQGKCSVCKDITFTDYDRVKRNEPPK